MSISTLLVAHSHNLFEKYMRQVQQHTRSGNKLFTVLMCRAPCDLEVVSSDKQMFNTIHTYSEFHLYMY